MSKIFRLGTVGSNTYTDWNSSPAFPYNSTARGSIKDPDGASARHEITSIPSPFARIDLVKTAFKEVCKAGPNGSGPDLDGKTIFHKMVSDTLDVAEIFFNIDKYQGQVEIIKWDPSQMLRQLKEAGIAGHAYLADALEKFLKADAATYNFAGLQNIYLLNYKQGRAELDIIGATSPATLFFSNANDLSFVKDIFFGEDKPFDNDYQPLYKRDFEFVKYLFAQRKAIGNFAGLFPEVDAYLTETLKTITDQAQKDELRNIDGAYLGGLTAISVSSLQQTNLAEVLGYPLYKKAQTSIHSSSDFTIKSKISGKAQPLVLPVEAGNRYADLQYTTGKWGKTNKAPFVDPQTDIAKRLLPFDGASQPYLTISDFLEDTVILVPHTLDSMNYFDGNLDNPQEERSYLLPVRPLLFEYFTAEDLRGKMADGRPMIEMQALSGNLGLKVTLRVPIKGKGNVSYVEYTRLYYDSRSADVEKNEGGMTVFKFSGFVMPQIRFNNESDAIYNVSCIQGADAGNALCFYKGAVKILVKSETCRCQNMRVPHKAVNYLIKGYNFDYIQVCANQMYAGLLLPVFKLQQEYANFEFAVDLGTSNTHIEYRKEREAPVDFSFSKDDRQLCGMFVPTRDENDVLTDLYEETVLTEKDFVPETVGEGDFRFPTRTVLSCAKTTDWNDVVDPFMLVNLPFTYDKRRDMPYNDIKCDIKWGKGNELRVMEAYVRCLMLLIRNKVLLNDGILRSTKITWFYPISMPAKRLDKLRETWNEAYKEYFGDGATVPMTESEAPIQYFFSKYASTKELVHVDIGGGTTDIAFAKNNEILLTTSFRFASNALFEDSFSELKSDNGIVNYHKEDILEVLKSKKLKELVNVFESSTNKRSSNMASFLFGLSENSIVRKAGVNPKSVDFNGILRDDEHFKIVFILFYTAILYHVAQIVKCKGLEVPRHLSFSGNGSKTLNVISSDPKLLARYAKTVFEKVLGKVCDKKLEILGLESGSNPKVTTCKGGIVAKPAADAGEAVVFKSDCTGFVGDADTYENITDAYKADTVSAVEDFFKFALEDMNKAFDFDKNFGVTKQSVEIAQRVAKEDLMTFLEKGIKQRREEVENSDRIEETFFFYPIKGVLQSISTEIYRSIKEEEL